MAKHYRIVGFSTLFDKARGWDGIVRFPEPFVRHTIPKERWLRQRAKEMGHVFTTQAPRCDPVYYAEG